MKFSPHNASENYLQKGRWTSGDEGVHTQVCVQTKKTV